MARSDNELISAPTVVFRSGFLAKILSFNGEHYQTAWRKKEKKDENKRQKWEDEGFK